MDQQRTRGGNVLAALLTDPDTRWARLPALALGAVAVVLVGVHAVVHNVPGAPQLAEHDNPVRLFLDVSGEHNLWAWFNSTLLAVAGVTHLLAALLARAAGAPAWRWWGVTAAALLAMSLDDMTVLHERLQGPGLALGGGSGLTYAAWVLPGAVVGVVVALAFWRLARLLGPAPRVLLVVGLATFLGAAVGIEAVGNAVLERLGPSALYGACVLVEELLEALGAVVLLVCPLYALRVGRDDEGLRVRYEGGRVAVGARRA